MNKPKFTEQQLENWKLYEKLRKSGRHNMITANAKRATGLSPEDYWFVWANYDELKEVINEPTN